MLQTSSWMTITRTYLGDTRVKNEIAVQNLILAQQQMQPVSLQESRNQVLRLRIRANQPRKKGRIQQKSKTIRRS